MNRQLDLFNLNLSTNTSSDDTGLLNHPRTVGCLGVSADISYERDSLDYYATDPIAAEWLIQLENLNNNVWECACGEGNLAKVFEQNGFNVKATDLIDRGYGQGGIDFLFYSEPYNGDIVTNSPYQLAQPFIEHALALIPTGNKVCMFLKVQFLEGKSRRNLFETCPPRRVWISSSRIQCSKQNATLANGSMVAYAWYVWEKGYKGTTELRWFN